MANWPREKIEWDASGNAIFVGKAKDPKLNENEEGWHIKKITWDASGNAVDIEKIVGIWAKRASLDWGD